MHKHAQIAFMYFFESPESYFESNSALVNLLLLLLCIILPMCIN